MNSTANESTGAQQVMEACVAHARQMLASQQPVVDGRAYDFMPSFVEMTTQIYLAGVMWRFGEQFEMPTAPRDRGFICLMSLLVSDGMSAKKAQERIAYLNQVSRAADGRDVLAMTEGYNARSADGSLARVFDTFRGTPEVSGAPYRLLDRSKPVALVLAIAGLIVPLILGRSWGEALGIGIVLGVSTLAIALAIYRQAMKSKDTKS